MTNPMQAHLQVRLLFNKRQPPLQTGQMRGDLSFCSPTNAAAAACRCAGDSLSLAPEQSEREPLDVCTRPLDPLRTRRRFTGDVLPSAAVLMKRGPRKSVATGRALVFPPASPPTKAHSIKRSLRRPFSCSRQPLFTNLLGGISILFVLPSIAPAQEAAAAKTGDAWAAAPMDWPNWRGPELNGVSRETGLVDRWTPEGQNVLWKREDLGGRSTPICMRGKLYTLVRDHPDTDIEGEKVVCLDAATGKTIWENVFNVFLSDVPAPRVGWSSVVGDPETGNVFSLGVCGFLQCINGQTGK